MTTISGLGRTDGTRAAPARLQGGFTVAPGAAPSVASAAAPSAAAGVAGLLAMQEAGQDTVRDREARRHGRALLAAMAELQHALLGGEGGAGLDRLATLLRGAPPPDDPALATVQRALMVRAAVELARAGRGRATGAATG